MPCLGGLPVRRRVHLRRHLSYANCCATLALFIAVSTGGAFAASQIDGRTIKKNSIPASALMNNSVTSAKIKNGQIIAADVKRGSLPPAVLTKATQEKIASLDGDPSQGGTKCPDGSDLSKCSLVDVVPSGVGQPCRDLGSQKVGVWKDANGLWLCTIDLGNGVTSTVGPALAGKLSGAVNA